LGAIAILASSLTVGPLAHQAQAWEYFVRGPYVNSADMVSAYWNDTGSGANISVVGSFDSTIPNWNWSNRPNGASQVAGGSATLYVKASINGSNCTPEGGDPDYVRLQIRNQASTSPVGGTSLDYSWSTVEAAACNSGTWSATPTVYFDNNPLDGDNSDGALAPGTYSIYLAITDADHLSAIYPMDTAGAQAWGDVEQYTSVGTFTVTPAFQGVMLGLSENRTTPTSRKAVLDADVDAFSDNPAKGYATTRLYRSSWGLPDAEVQTFINAGKTVLWSNKPPEVSGIPSWAAIANGTNDGGASGLDAQLQTLYNWADGVSGHASQVIYVAVEHEPHDSSSSFKNGTKCTVGVDCHGSDTDYKNAWDHVRARVTYWDTHGYPGMSTRVKLAYCAVASNATPDSNNGLGDLMYPGKPDVDLLAHDLYNYYHYTQGGNGYTFNTTQSWKGFRTSANGGSLSATAGIFGDPTTGMITLARNQGLKLFMAEFGSHPGCPGGGVTDEGCSGTETAGGTGSGRIQSRDAWFRDMADWLRQFDTQNTLVGFVYYHQKPSHTCSALDPCSGNPKWNWQFTNTSPARAGSAGWEDGFINSTTYNGSNPGYYKGVPYTL
jgi:hypothetical protein